MRSSTARTGARPHGRTGVGELIAARRHLVIDIERPLRVSTSVARLGLGDETARQIKALAIAWRVQAMIQQSLGRPPFAPSAMVSTINGNKRSRSASG
jgi:hypothetical protein